MNPHAPAAADPARPATRGAASASLTVAAPHGPGTIPPAPSATGPDTTERSEAA